MCLYENTNMSDVEHKKIFIVDDDPSILEVMTIVLEEKGYDVSSISSGPQFFELLKKEPHPDLIFLDLWISGSEGTEITKQLKADKKTKNIPIVIVSALNDLESIAENAGADGFLEKPFEIENLLSIVEKHT